jgi:hypothetical protein
MIAEILYRMPALLNQAEAREFPRAAGHTYVAL